MSGSGTQPRYTHRQVTRKVWTAVTEIRTCFALTRANPVGFVVYPLTLSTAGSVLEIGPSRLSRPRNPDLDRCMEGVLHSIAWGPTGLKTPGHLSVAFFQPTIPGYRGVPPFCLKPE